jgi:hypothetical protein
MPQVGNFTEENFPPLSQTFGETSVVHTAWTGCFHLQGREAARSRELLKTFCRITRGHTFALVF